MLKRLASNAAANATNGAVIAAFQMSMTAVMARTGSARDLAVWALAASVAGFAPLLSCNVAAAVARRLSLAPANPEQSQAHQHAVMTAARTLAARLAGFAGALGVALAVAVPILYSELLDNVVWPTALVVGSYFFGSCWVVLGQPAQGLLMAQRRNWAITNAGFFARALALICLVAMLSVFSAPVWLGVMVCSLALWSGTLLLFRTAATSSPSPVLTATALQDEYRQITSIVRGFAAWNVTSAAVQAATVPIVALLNSAQATQFFLAFTLVSVVLGASVAMSSALIAPIAQLLASSQRADVGRPVWRATLLVWLCVNVALALLLWTAGPICALWLGDLAGDSVPVRQFIALLWLQHGLRSAAIVASIVLAMGARPSTMLRASLVEPLTAALIAIPFGIRFGAFGFLCGLAVAGLVSTLCVAWVTSRRILGEKVGTASLFERVGLLVVGSVAWCGFAVVALLR